MKILVGILFFLVIYVIAAGAQNYSGQYYSQLEAVTKQRDELLTLVSEQDTQRNWMIAQRDGANQQVAQLNGEVAQIKADLAAAQQAGAEKESTITQLRQDLDGKNNEIAILQGKVTALDQELKQWQASIDGLNGEVEQLNAQIDNLKAQIALKDQENAGLREDVAQLNQTIDEMAVQATAVAPRAAIPGEGEKAPIPVVGPSTMAERIRTIIVLVFGLFVLSGGGAIAFRRDRNTGISR